MRYIKPYNIFESENFDAEREMSDILGYDVKLFNQVSKLLFLSQEELEDWFEEEIGKDQPNWDLIEILQSQHGIEFNYKDLHWATDQNKVGLAKYWLDKGIDKDARDSVLRTPLHWAAIYNSEAVAKLLIDAGADKDAKNKYLSTPLHFAAVHNSEAVAKLLIDAGADKDAQTENLLTPLHFAAIRNSEAIIKLLIDAGADKGSKDNKGNTAWDYANDELRQSLPELNPNAKQFESENFNAERKMSDFLGYDVKLFNQVNKLLFLSKEELEEWFYNEMGKEEPSWDLIQVLKTQHGIEFDYKNLHWATDQNKVGLAKYWLDRGADKDAQVMNLWTPLHLAAIHNSEAVAKLLIDAGAEKDVKDNRLRTPLHQAAIYDREAVAKLLLDAGADKDARSTYLYTPLHFATINDNEAVAKLLIDAGADKGAKDIHNQTAWYYANDELRQSLPELNPEVKQFESENFDAERKMSDILGYDVKLMPKVNKFSFMSDREIESWFSNQIESNNPDIHLIDALVKTGYKFEELDNNLIWAIQRDETGLLKILIHMGADKNVQDEDFRTPLHWAVYKNNIEAVEILLEIGAEIDNANNPHKQTPLIIATIYQRLEIIKLLLEAGANPNIQDKHLQTCLHKAAIKKSIPITKLLIDGGASLDIKDRDNNTPWDLADKDFRKSVPELNPSHNYKLF